jgi:hypothetical protein
MTGTPRDGGTGSIRKLPSGRCQARVLLEGKRVAFGHAAPRDAFGRQDAGTWVDPGHGRVAFGSYADDWVASRHDLAMRTKHDYEDLLRLQLKPAFESTPTADISALSVRAGGLRPADRTDTDGHRSRTDFSQRSSTRPLKTA